MKLDDITSRAGKFPKHKRLGRGTGSGQGKTAGRGTKGRGARAGASFRWGYEGGSNPIIARSPKRGFNNFNFRVEYQAVNLGDLDKFPANSTVDAAAMKKFHLIGDASKPVKVLGNGAVSKSLTVVASCFSKSAAEKIAAAGGKVEGPVPMLAKEAAAAKKAEAAAAKKAAEEAKKAAEAAAKALEAESKAAKPKKGGGKDEAKEAKQSKKTESDKA